MSDADKRDARLLCLIGLGFAAVSGAACAVSFHILDEPLLLDNRLAGVAVTCAAAAAVTWLWAAVKLARSYFVARWSWRRTAAYVLLVCLGTALSDWVLMQLTHSDLADNLDSARKQGRYYVLAPEHPWLLLHLVNGSATGPWNSITTLSLEPDDPRALGLRNAFGPRSWWECRVERAALRRSTEAAARCGWTTAAVRRELVALTDAAGQLLGQPAASVTAVQEAVRTLPGVTLKTENDFIPELSELALVDAGQTRHKGTLRFDSPNQTRFRLDGRRLWVHTIIHGWDDVTLVDLERHLCVSAGPARVWEGFAYDPLGVGDPRGFFISPLNCLGSLTLAWTVILAACCYLRLRPKSAPPTAKNETAQREQRATDH